MLMPGRFENTTRYRYGFQGQEMDNEVKGVGNSINYTFRMHDPRLGRFFAVDPLTKEYPHYTPYSFSGNKLISHIELEGLEDVSYGFTLTIKNIEVPKSRNISLGVFNSNQLNQTATWDNKVNYDFTNKTLKVDSAISFDHEITGLPFGASVNTNNVTFAAQYKKEFKDNGQNQIMIGITTQKLGTDIFMPATALIGKDDNLFTSKPATFKAASLDTESNKLLDIEGGRSFSDFDIKSYFVISLDEVKVAPAANNTPQNSYTQAAKILASRKPNPILSMIGKLVKGKMKEWSEAGSPKPVDPNKEEETEKPEEQPQN